MREQPFYSNYPALLRGMGITPAVILVIESACAGHLPLAHKLGHSFQFNKGDVTLWEYDFEKCAEN